jgi:hypothetical protein
MQERALQAWARIAGRSRDEPFTTEVNRMAAPARVAAALLVAFVAILILVACGEGTSPEAPDPAAFSMTGPFMQHVDEYLTLADAPQSLKGKPSFRGKVIFIDTKERHVDWTFTDPLVKTQSPLLAYSPETVAAVVLVRRRNQEVGLYAGGGKGYVVHATVIVADPARNKVIAKKTFVSGQPPGSAQMGWNGYGLLPLKKMLAWVRGMAKP